MSLPAFALAVTVVFGVAAVARLRPRKVKNTYRTIERWRKILWGVVIVGVVWTFIRSGRPELIFAALVSLALATVYLVVEKPYKNLV